MEAYDILRQDRYFKGIQNPEDTYYSQKSALLAMEEYGKQMYNQAIDDAVKNAETKYLFVSTGDYSGSSMYIVDKQSILKLKKQ